MSSLLSTPPSTKIVLSRVGNNKSLTTCQTLIVISYSSVQRIGYKFFIRNKRG